MGASKCLVQPRPDIRAHSKLDALDFGLYEHDPHVLRLRRVGVSTQRLDRIRLAKTAGTNGKKGKKENSFTDYPG